MSDSNAFGRSSSGSWFWPWVFIAALALALIMCLWMHINGPRSIQTAVSECVAPIVGSTSLKTGNVQVHGRDVHLSGEVDSLLDQKALVEDLESQDCTNKVVNNLKAVDREPASLQVTAFGDNVTLTGELPSQADIDTVHTSAATHFGADNVQNQLQLIENGREASWISGIDPYMAQMSMADPSGLDANDERIILTGMVRDEDSKTELGNKANAAFLDTVSVDNQIEVRLPTTTASLMYANTDAGVELTGELPDQVSIDQAVSAATEAYGADRVDNKLTLNKEVKAAAWLAGLGASLPVIASAAGAKLGATDDGVTIDGLVDAPEKSQAIEDAVRASVGELPVDNRVVVEIPKTTSMLKLAMADGANGRIQISGDLADTAAVDNAVAAAGAMFSEDRIDNSVAVSDRVLPADWLAGLPTVVSAYESADNGAIELSDDGVVLSGLVDEEEKKTAVADAAASLGLSVDNQIEVVARGDPAIEYLLQGETIELTGELASDEQVDGAVAAAESAFGAAAVTNSLTVGERLKEAVWLDRVNSSLPDLKAFESGSLAASAEGVTLEGIVADPGQRETAIASLMSDDGVFNESVEVVPYIAPSLTYEVTEGKIKLQGTLSDQRAVDSAARAATDAFGAGNVDMGLSVGERHSSASWLDGVNGVVADLTNLESGVLEANDNGISIRGIADEAVKKDTVVASLTSSAGEIAFSEDIKVMPYTPSSVKYLVDAGKINLQGTLSNQQEVDDAANAASDVFGADNVDMALDVGERYRPASWLGGVNGAIADLQNLETGVLEASDAGISVSGVTDEAGKKEAVVASFSGAAGDLAFSEDINVMPYNAPSLQYTVDGSAITLEGTLSSQKEVDDAAKAATNAYGGANVAMKLSVGERYSPAGWLEGVNSAVSSLKELETGMLEASDAGISVSGVTDADAKKDSVVASVSGAAGEIAFSEDVKVMPYGAPSVMYMVDGDSISLQGTLSNQQEVDDAVAAANAVYGAGNVSSALIVGERHSPAGWLGGVNGAVADLKVLETGMLEASDAGISVSGVTDVDAKKDSVVASVSGAAGEIAFSEDVKVMPYSSPSVMYMVEGDRISLEGTLSSQQEVDEAAKAATNVYGGDNVDMKLSVGERYSPAGWLEGVNGSVSSLKELETGMLEASDAGISVSGVTDADAKKDSVVASVSGAAGEIAFSEDVKVMPYSAPSVMYMVEGDSISLQGTLSNQQEVDDAVAAANAVYGAGNVSSALIVGERHSPAGWLGGVNGAVADLKVLETGMLEASDAGISVSGVTDVDAKKDSVVASVSGAAGEIAFSEDVKVMPYSSPSVMYMVEGDGISLQGTLSNQQEVDDAEAAAAAVYGGANVNSALIVGDRYSSASWLGGVNGAVADLKVLETGMLEASDAGITVSGVTDADAKKDSVVASVSGAAGEIAFSEDVKVMPYSAPSVMYMVEGDGISLQGTLSNQQEVDDAEAAAAAVYGGANVNSALIVGERHSPAGWLGGVNGAVADLKVLETGMLEASDAGISVSGVTDVDAKKDSVVASVSGAAGEIAFSEDVKVMPYSSPSVMYMVEGDGISLQGTLSNQQEVDDAEAAAAAVYGGANVNSALIVGERHSPAGWLGGVNGAVADLKVLETGMLEASDAGISVSGVTDVDAKKDSVVASVSGAAGEIAFSEDVKVMPYSSPSVMYMVEGDGISLQGTLSNQQEVDDAEAAAAAVYGGANVNSALIVGDRYSSASWLGGVNGAVADLKALESGMLEANDAGISISGITDEVGKKDSVVASVRAAAGELAFTEDVKVRPYTSSLVKYTVDGDRISLDGTLSSAGEVDGAIAAAQSIYGADNVTSSLTVGDRYSPATWLGGVNGAISDLKVLETGVLAASDSGISVSGVTDTDANKGVVVASVTGAAGELEFSEDVKVIPYETPSLSYLIDGDRISLQGTLSNQEEIDSAVAAANSAYGADNVTNALNVGERYSAAQWLEGINGAVADLKVLETGQLDASDAGISVSGVTDEAGKKDTVVASVSNGAREIAFSEDVKVRPYTSSLVKYVVDGESIRLEGTLSSDAEVEGAIAAAISVYGEENVTSTLTVGQRYSPASWLGGINGAVTDLKGSRNWSTGSEQHRRVCHGCD